MNRWIAAVILIPIAFTAVFAKGPEVQLVDGKLSVNAETISLGWLLRLVDLATGMKSSVPPEWVNRNISVKFTGLDVNDGLRKIFQGLPLDYVVIERQSVIVTAAMQTGPAAASNNALSVQAIEQPVEEDARIEPIQDEPPTIEQTPLGPFLRSRSPQDQVNTVATSQGPDGSLLRQEMRSIEQPIIQPAMQVLPRFPNQAASPTPSGPLSPSDIPNPFASDPNNPLFGVLRRP